MLRPHLDAHRATVDSQTRSRKAGVPQAVWPTANLEGFPDRSTHPKASRLGSLGTFLPSCSLPSGMPHTNVARPDSDLQNLLACDFCFLTAALQLTCGVTFKPNSQTMVRVPIDRLKCKNCRV